MEFIKPANLINLVFSPTKVFEKVKEKPKFIVAILIISLAIGLTYLVLPSPSLEEITMYVQKNMASFDNTMKEQIIKSMQRSTSPLFKGISSFTSTFISFFISALVLLFIVKIMGGEIDYKKALSILSISTLVIILNYIYYLIYYLITKQNPLNTLDIGKNLSEFIRTYLNVFAIWKYVLIGVGIYTVCELSKVKSIVAATIYALLTLLIPAISFFVFVK